MTNNLAQLDLVYPLRSMPVPCEELRYSLRSVCENMPHKDIYIVGTFLPAWLDTSKVHQLAISDPRYGQGQKAANVSDKLRAVCQNPDISDPFILMNDDFFVLQEITDIPYYSWGEIYEHLKNLIDRHDYISQYMRTILDAGAYLSRNGYTTYDFGVHAPLIIEKDTMSQVLDLGEEGLYRRTIYCNMKGVEPTITEDFKCYDVSQHVDFARPFASTQDSTFNRGVAGHELRQRFNKTCKYEKEVKK